MTAPAQPVTEAPDKDLAEHIADLVDRWAYDPGTPPADRALVCAVWVLADRRIQSALIDQRLLESARARHQPVQWAPDSPTVVCSCGSGDWESCKERLALAGES